ncbi:LPS export ABC transporter permease LptF [Thalassococcus sp. S3]|uniref:LPS export ABC transporter permease LptF n=1 Tax=Thalassococcus sp. S3 TaxID=2017482 RepID=UPI001023F86D|nr:LPS export ABC transporter permease LptF [Thalassococcus sp. S3]QBF31627.1 LPS export ABC transporter permease LptF [Thalassococcus sp. S3]
MSRYDRYVLSQLLLLFGFFALILVAVFWINRAVVLFDRLIADGQSAMVFLEFTALGLPNLIRMVVPMAAFAAAVYVTNRLNGESELVVMQATGSGPSRLARPFLAFGLVTALMMSVLTHILLPASINQLEVREAEISQNITARLLTEGTFLHPAPNVTFYIRSIDPDGTLNDVYLSDRRVEGETVTYTASRAFLVRDAEQSKLIMVDGLAQRLSEEANRLSTTNFADFSYDISALIEDPAAVRRNIRALPTWELMTDPAGIEESDGYAQGPLAEELHLRFARALICISVALIGFSTLMVGGFSRFGVWRQIVIAFVLLIFMEIGRGLVSEPVLEDPRFWPLIYIPSLAGILIAILFLRIAGRPLRIPWPTGRQEAAA